MELRQVGLDVRSRNVEQWARQVEVAPAHRSQAFGAAASEQVEEQRLDLVILRVTEGDGGAIGIGGGLPEERVTRAAGGVLRVRDVVRGAGGSEVIYPGGSHRGHEVAVGSTFRAPAMIEMRDRKVQRKGRKDFAQHRKEGQRIGAARHGDHDTLSWFEDVVQSYRDGDAPGKHHW